MLSLVSGASPESLGGYGNYGSNFQPEVSEEELVDNINARSFSNSVVMMNIGKLKSQISSYQQYVNRQNGVPAAGARGPVINYAYMTPDGRMFVGGSGDSSLSAILSLFSPLVANSYMHLFRNIHGQNMESVPTPLSDDDLKQLRKCKYEEIDEKGLGREVDTECSICKDEFKEGDAVTVLPCGGKHFFHDECIDNWLGKLSKKCPLCRTDLEDLLKEQNSSSNNDGSDSSVQNEISNNDDK